MRGAYNGTLKRNTNLRPHRLSCFCLFLALFALLVTTWQRTQHGSRVIKYSPGGENQIPWWQSFKDRRTIYLQPECGLGNQLVSISSALTTAKREKLNLKIVFSSWDDPVNSILWSDMFSEPQIDYRDSFPDGSFLSENTTAKIFDLGQMIKWNGMRMTWKDIKNEFSRDPNGGLALCMPVCLWQEGSFPSDEAWFYKSLKPTEEIKNMIESFKASVAWEHYQWVGVHVRRGDRIRDLSDYLIEQNSTADLLPLDNYVFKMKAIKSMLPSQFFPSTQEVHDFLVRFETLGLNQMDIRFFLATDDPEAAAYIMPHFSDGEIVVYEHSRAFTTTQYIHQTQLALVDLFMLASCEVLIGTPTSSFSLAAKLIGSGLYTEPELFAAE